jgi:hypothetical protein
MQWTCLVTLLRPPVVSLDARKPFAARETVKITMFTEAIDKGHASSKATGRHELLSLFIAKLQAGQYRVHVLDDSDFTVMEITSADGSTSALFEVQEAEANSTPAKTELIFNKYGNRYFLAQLFDEGNPSGSKVLESRYEKKISKATAEAQARVPAHHQGQQGK